MCSQAWEAFTLVWQGEAAIDGSHGKLAVAVSRAWTICCRNWSSQVGDESEDTTRRPEIELLLRQESRGGNRAYFYAAFSG